MPEHLITVAITTHNRREDLSFTLDKLGAYKDQIAGIIVCADGCTDGTQQFVQETYPEIQLLENNPGRGSIPSRNRMIQLASTPMILLLDDDSYPLESHFFTEVETVMADHPEIGVLTFPQRSEEFPESLTVSDFGNPLRIGTFTSSGAVIRQSLFRELGAFPEMFFHAYEEPDFSLRVHAAGYQVVQWNKLTVRHHFTGAMRDEGRTHRRHARNEMWSTIIRAPALYLLPLIFYRIYSQFRYAVKRGSSWVVREPQWWWAAFKGIPKACQLRQPVSRVAYKSWLNLMRCPQTFNNEAKL